MVHYSMNDYIIICYLSINQQQIKLLSNSLIFYIIYLFILYNFLDNEINVYNFHEENYNSIQSHIRKRNLYKFQWTNCCIENGCSNSIKNHVVFQFLFKNNFRGRFYVESILTVWILLHNFDHLFGIFGSFYLRIPNLMWFVQTF